MSLGVERLKMAFVFTSPGQLVTGQETQVPQVAGGCRRGQPLRAQCTVGAGRKVVHGLLSLWCHPVPVCFGRVLRLEHPAPWRGVPAFCLVQLRPAIGAVFGREWNGRMEM